MFISGGGLLPFWLHSNDCTFYITTILADLACDNIHRALFYEKSECRWKEWLVNLIVFYSHQCSTMIFIWEGEGKKRSFGATSKKKCIANQFIYLHLSIYSFGIDYIELIGERMPYNSHSYSHQNEFLNEEIRNVWLSSEENWYLPVLISPQTLHKRLATPGEVSFDACCCIFIERDGLVDLRFMLSTKSLLTICSSSHDGRFKFEVNLYVIRKKSILS